MKQLPNHQAINLYDNHLQEHDLSLRFGALRSSVFIYTIEAVITGSHSLNG